MHGVGTAVVAVAVVASTRDHVIDVRLDQRVTSRQSGCAGCHDRAGPPGVVERLPIQFRAVAPDIETEPAQRAGHMSVSAWDRYWTVRRDSDTPFLAVEGAATSCSTSSSAMVGWIATHSSSCDLRKPAFTATASTCRISGASGPIMCAPTICRWSRRRRSCTARARCGPRARSSSGGSPRCRPSPSRAGCAPRLRSARRPPAADG